MIKISLRKTLFLTVLALIAFAGNSIVCRMALKDDNIDPASFTSIRLISGAIALLLIVVFTNTSSGEKSKGSWKSGFILFLYAAAFSFAYLSLDTATGAVILFGAVQITMIFYAFLSGHKMNKLEWLGVIISLIGFLYLMLPGAKAPSLFGFILMSASGIGWGIYSIHGKKSKDPIRDTAYNFIKSLPFLAVLLYFVIIDGFISPKGLVLALFSGIVTSGAGYVIWYTALKGLTTVQASIVQLFVPVIAAIGGLIIVKESLSDRLIIASILILGGILLLILNKNSKGILKKKKKI